MVRLPLELRYIDAKGLNSSLASIYVEVSTFSAALALAQEMQDAIAPITTANFLGANFAFTVDVLGSPAASPDADLFSRAGLLFRTATDMGWINVPSPDPAIFDPSGEMQGYRISRNRLNALGLLAPLETALEPMILPNGSPFPTTFLVGGRMGVL